MDLHRDFVFDEKFNLYWTSSRSRRHSHEILQDPKTAVTIVLDAKQKQALQMSGRAFEVPNEQLENVHALYQKRFGPKDYDLEQMKQHRPNDRSYWVFMPTEIWLWDEVNFQGVPKQRFL